jgi:RNA recognition motif-containing protein
MSRGHAYVEFDNADEAEKAVKYMDGGEYSKTDLQPGRRNNFVNLFLQMHPDNEVSIVTMSITMLPVTTL